MEVSKIVNVCYIPKLNFVVLGLAEVMDEIINSHRHRAVVMEHERVGSAF